MLSKITALNNLIASLADRPNTALSPTALKQYFDSQPDQLKTAINALIDALLATAATDSGAHNIGSAAITGVAGSTVYAQLVSLKQAIDGVTLGTIPDGTITAPKLAPSLTSQLVPYGGSTTNVGNAYALAYTIAALSTGFGISTQINVSSTGAATLNIDGKGAKPIKKPNGLDATNLVAGSIYTFRYNGTNFILQGEGGEYGTATAGDVLAPLTIGTETGLVAGTLSLTGTATDADVLAGTTYYNTAAKTKRTGTKTNQGALNVVPNAATQTFAGGSYTGITVQPQEGGVKAGSVVIVNDPTMFTNQSATPTKKREFQLNAGGTYRISFDLYIGGGGDTARGQIYRNGAAIGQLRQTASGTAVIFTEDIAGWKENDLMSFYINSVNGSLEARILNFKLSILAPVTTV